MLSQNQADMLADVMQPLKKGQDVKEMPQTGHAIVGSTSKKFRLLSAKPYHRFLCV